jgi:ribonuclease J
MGIPEQNVFVVENGIVLELDENSLTIGPRIPGGYVFIDGSGVGDVGPSVIRERERLSQSGFFVAVIHVNDDGQMIGYPELITRGFVYMDESQDLLAGAEDTIFSVVNTNDRATKEQLSKKIESALYRYFSAETGRRPMIHAVVK